VNINQDKRVIEIYLPSELGYEKVAMACAATLARQQGFPQDKIEDLKTAIAEACTNAIEHGNSFNFQIKVSIILTVDHNSIQVSIIDAGHKSIPTPLPDRSLRTDFRGMGLYLIQMLMDKVEIKSQPGRNEVQMISYLQSPSLAS